MEHVQACTGAHTHKIARPQFYLHPYLIRGRSDKIIKESMAGENLYPIMHGSLERRPTVTLRLT